jgi:hypothetical protein
MSNSRHDFSRFPSRTHKKKSNGQKPDRGHGTVPIPHRVSVPGANGAELAAARERIHTLQVEATLDAERSLQELVAELVLAIRENTDVLREIHGLGREAMDIGKDAAKAPQEELD